MRPRLSKKEARLLEWFVVGLALKWKRKTYTTEEIDVMLDLLLRDDIHYLLQKIQGKGKRGPRIGAKYKEKKKPVVSTYPPSVRKRRYRERKKIEERTRPRRVT